MAYPIGTPGTPWGEAERAAWLARAGVAQRSYRAEVLDALDAFKGDFDVAQYGALSIDPARYPLFVVKTRAWDAAKPSVLVTGGVHGYETSGVQGALRFVATEMAAYAKSFNVAVCPCVSPWGYECIQRWNSATLDPNREFVADSKAEECAAVVDLVASLNVAQWCAHLDLHETTNTDLTEFMPAMAARDGKAFEAEIIPDGFYIMGNKANPQLPWLTAIIDAVRKVTHIAPPDDDDQIIGNPRLGDGVVVSPSPGKGKGVTNATYAGTTEVYPDSATRPVSGAVCNDAQVAAITGALDYVLARPGV